MRENWPSNGQDMVLGWGPVNHPRPRTCTVTFRAPSDRLHRSPFTRASVQRPYFAPKQPLEPIPERRTAPGRMHTKDVQRAAMGRARPGAAAGPLFRSGPYGSVCRPRRRYRSASATTHGVVSSMPLLWAMCLFLSACKRNLSGVSGAQLPTSRGIHLSRSGFGVPGGCVWRSRP